MIGRYYGALCSKSLCAPKSLCSTKPHNPEFIEQHSDFITQWKYCTDTVERYTIEFKTQENRGVKGHAIQHLRKSKDAE